jgi:hypothetical protein
MDRTHGRSPSGVRVDGPVPHGHWKVVTLTAAVRLGGVGACPAFDGATNSTAFEIDQADSTSSDRWCEPTRAGYYRRRRVA